MSVTATGFLPLGSAFCLTWNFPRLDIRTSTPDSSASLITSNRASTAFDTSDFFTSVVLKTLSTTSALVRDIRKTPQRLFVEYRRKHLDCQGVVASMAEEMGADLDIGHFYLDGSFGHNWFSTVIRALGVYTVCWHFCYVSAINSPFLKFQISIPSLTH